MNEETSKKVFLAVIIGATLIIVIFGIGVYFFDKKIINKTQTSVANIDESTAWQTYENYRYDFSVKEPSDFVVNELENDGGISFTNDDTYIKVFAFSNAQSENTEQYLSREFDKLALNNLKITSNTSGTRIADKCVFDTRAWEYKTSDGKDKIIKKDVCLKNDIFYVVEFETTINQLDKYEPIFEKVAKSINIK